MGPNDKIPDLKTALRETSDYKIPESDGKKKPVDPDDIPPPPGDWTTHAVTKIILGLILLGGIAVGIWKGPVLYNYFRTHAFGFWLAVLVIFVAVLLISVAFWKHRTEGNVETRSWRPDRKRRPR